MPLTAEPVRLEMNSRVPQQILTSRNRPEPTLLAVTRLNGNALAPFGAATRKYRLTALGLHAAAESVLLGTFAAVGLECALGHGKTALLY